MKGLIRNVCASLVAILAYSQSASANDAIFPAQSAAASSIGWKNNYFTVKGKPVVLSSGEIHYARVPKEQWRERLMKMKRAGFNTVSTYVFWNAQEPTPGVFDYSDNLDLDAWLNEIELLGMYAIVRPGPYNCAEWLAGGIPQWLSAKGVQVRNSAADYLAAADKYYESVIPIIAKHQIHKGGGVILMQVENEHPAGWGTEGDAHLKHLYDKARTLGMEIPMFYSGLHHATDPTGNTPFGNRTSPWFSTETWSGWYSLPFGEMNANDLNTLRRTAWKVIGFGGAGNTFYVFHGGTNFGYEGDTSTTSYDYRAPLGEASQLRQGYFAVRNPAMFSRAFESLMANSQDGGNIATVSAGVRAYVRKSPSDGVAVFLDNQGTSAVQTQVKLSSPQAQLPSGSTQLSVAPNEIRAVVVAAPWTANATFAYLATNVLGKLNLGSKAFVVVHGRPGESGEIAIQYQTAPATAPTSPWTFDAAAKAAKATFTYPTGDSIVELPVSSGDGTEGTFVVINSGMADRTWFTDKAVYVGATYVDDGLGIQTPVAGGKVSMYAAEGRSDVTVPSTTAPSLPALSGWQWRDAAPEVAANFDDSTWKSSAQPKPFGANDFQNGYGWYRAKFTSNSTAATSAKIEGVRATPLAFVNGKQATVTNGSFSFTPVSGENTVAILGRHEGLDKMYNVTGATGTSQYAGIWGSVTSGSSALASTWKFRGGLGGMDETAVVGRVKNWTTFLEGTWSDTQAQKPWPAFWKTTFKNPLTTGMYATIGLRTQGLSSGSVWLNGHNLGRFSGNIQLYVPEGWLAADNTLVIYDASGNAPGSSVKLEYIETRARVVTGSTGTGGDAGAGGAMSTGGTTTTDGGVLRTGGMVASTGGMTGAGGVVSTGGRGSGGAASSGGAVVSSTGGVSGSGGVVRTGGASSPATTGGSVVASTGGTSTSGGTPGTTTTGTSGDGCSCALGDSKQRGSLPAALSVLFLFVAARGIRRSRRPAARTPRGRG